LVGADADMVLADLRNMLGRDEVPFLTFVAARSRIAEDWLVASGAKQYVILGGLTRSLGVSRGTSTSSK
jgi:hypothetical protein